MKVGGYVIRMNFEFNINAYQVLINTTSLRWDFHEMNPVGWGEAYVKNNMSGILLLTDDL